MFELDPQIAASSFFIIDWPLSRVLLKNNANFPWFILVPRRPNLTEMTQLSQDERYQLMDEINHASRIVQDRYKPDKVNIGALGNIVSQCHLHVIARFKQDLLWPHSIWQAGVEEKPYVAVDSLLVELKSVFS